MPIYAYKCESCGHAKDVLQKMSDVPLVDCPQCGAATFKKQLTAAGFQLKGSGWYVTDFRDAKSDGKSDSKSDGKGGDQSKESGGSDKADAPASTTATATPVKSDAATPSSSSAAPAPAASPAPAPKAAT